MALFQAFLNCLLCLPGGNGVPLAPAMGFLSLPSEAALPLTAGLLAGIYGAVAALAVLDFSMTETILIAVFLLISHNIIQEGIVQARSGLNFFKATIIRLLASVATVLCLAPMLPGGEDAGRVVAIQEAGEDL